MRADGDSVLCKRVRPPHDGFYEFIIDDGSDKKRARHKGYEVGYLYELSRRYRDLIKSRRNLTTADMIESDYFGFRILTHLRIWMRKAIIRARRTVTTPLLLLRGANRGDIRSLLPYA